MEEKTVQEVQKDLQDILDYYQLSSPLPDDVKKEILQSSRKE